MNVTHVVETQLVFGSRHETFILYTDDDTGETYRKMLIHPSEPTEEELSASIATAKTQVEYVIQNPTEDSESPEITILKAKGYVAAEETAKHIDDLPQI